MVDPIASDLVAAATRDGATIATAESCTGGMIASALTDVAGSSAVFERGFVTYSNEAKRDMLGVEAASLEAHGAVSSEIAAQMALGAIKRSRASLAVAVTGIAGPAGGTPDKPVGTVHVAVAARGEEQAEIVELRRLDLARAFEEGGRDGVRRATVTQALQLLRAALATGAP